MAAAGSTSLGRATPGRRREQGGGGAQESPGRPAHHGTAGEDPAEAAPHARAAAGSVARVDGERAFLAAPLSLVISDPAQEDEPLVWVNETFLASTGYTADEVLGHNCRFLQGPGTDPAAVAEIRDALAAGRGITTTLLNYRKDGSAFWNELSLSQVLDDEGRLVSYVGVQRDVTDQVALQQARVAALRSAEEARDALRLLLRLSDALAPLDVRVALAGCVDVLTPGVASRAAVLLLRTGEPDLEVAADSEEAAGERVAVGPLVASVLADARTDPRASTVQDTAEGQRLVAALVHRSQLRGVLDLTRVGGVFDDATRALVVDVARRTALALDSAELHARDAGAAEAFQRSLLPVLPEVPGLALAARFEPSEDGAAVGGDWYDVVPLPDGALALCVGDVMGHDRTAAAGMGQLRSTARAYAYEGLGPAEVLERTDRLTGTLSAPLLATAVMGRLERGDGGGWRRLRWSSAGHPPGLLRRRDGSVQRLDEANDALIGLGSLAGPDGSRPEASLDVAPGDLLLLFTDGLVESRQRGVDEGVGAVCEVLAACPPDVDLDALCDDVLAQVVTRFEDDVALLAVRVL